MPGLQGSGHRGGGAEGSEGEDGEDGGELHFGWAEWVVVEDGDRERERRRREVSDDDGDGEHGGGEREGKVPFIFVPCWSEGRRGGYSRGLAVP